MVITMPSCITDIETVALLAAEFIGREESRLNGLLGMAGMDAQAAKQALSQRDAGFLGHILSYLLSDERWAQEFAQAYNLTPDDLHQASSAFGAGRLMD